MHQRTEQYHLIHQKSCRTAMLETYFWRFKNIERVLIGIFFTTICWEKVRILHINIATLPQTEIPYISQLVWDLFFEQENRGNIKTHVSMERHWHYNFMKKKMNVIPNNCFEYDIHHQCLFLGFPQFIRINLNRFFLQVG